MAKFDARLLVLTLNGRVSRELLYGVEAAEIQLAVR